MRGGGGAGWRAGCAAALAAAALVPVVALPEAQAGPTAACSPAPFLDNGVVRVGVDVDAGGAIGFLGPSGTGENLVNTWDLGRYIQQSYYSGPTPFVPPGAGANPGWPGWPWNPIQAGDSFLNGAPVTAMANDGSTLYVEAVPHHWALDDVPAEATMQAWISFDPSAPNVVRVYNVFRNHRTDGVEQHPGRDQELPAVYTNQPYERVVTYTGDEPFTGAPVVEIDTAIPAGETFPWKRWRSTEGWSALVDGDGWGLGVVHPGVVSTIGGRVGPDEPSPFTTGYLSPIRQEIIDHDITYAYGYALVLGGVDDVRAYAIDERVDGRPEHVFTHDRQHVVYRGAIDGGLPTGGALQVVATSLDPQIIGPAAHWDAADVPRLFVRAGFDTADDRAVLYFADASGSFDDARTVAFDVVGDGVTRTYEVDLAGHPLYEGAIGGLRLDPAISAASGDRVELHWISHRNDPPAAPAPMSPPVPESTVCAPAPTGSQAAAAAAPSAVAAAPRFTG